jgi:hypothetical protein
VCNLIIKQSRQRCLHQCCILELKDDVNLKKSDEYEGDIRISSQDTFTFPRIIISQL